MSYFNNIVQAISTLIDGMKVTMGYFVRPREYVTLQYPDEVWPVPSRNIGVGELDSYNTIRSKLTVDINDCIGCKACERACPVDCITIDAFRGGPDEDLGTTSNGTKIKLLVTDFTIDMSECMYCDLCVPPCPEDCIVMTPDYQFISNDNLKTDVTPEQRWRDRSLLIYQFSKVSEEERQRRKAEAKAAAAEKAAIMAAKKIAAEKAVAEAAEVNAEPAASASSSGEATETTSLASDSDPQVPSTAPEASNPETKVSYAIPLETIESSAPAEGDSDTPIAEPTESQNSTEDIEEKESENG
ncbi:4Fe-4S binding protein [bacterium]|nr:4Fe-4S binding protein [bacterium]